MTSARSKLVDTAVTRWYHTISRCVRRASLLGESDHTANDRKMWIEQRLLDLADVFAVSVGGFAIMDNHLHVLVRLDPQVAKDWSANDVIRRWWTLHPPRGTDRKLLTITQKLVDERAQDEDWVETTRQRLQSLGWFMKCLKEPLARMVNKAEECTGAFFDGRYKSIAILDDEALLSVCAYIDLNPLAAGLAATPEESQHTSVKQRIDHVRQQCRLDDLLDARLGSVAGSRSAEGLEEELWLVPIEDRRGLGSQREGMLDGFTLGNYLMLVEYTGRLYRDGRASISEGLVDIFDRIGGTADVWQTRLETLRGGKLVGRFLSGSRSRLREAAAHFGVRCLANLSGTAAA